MVPHLRSDKYPGFPGTYLSDARLSVMALVNQILEAIALDMSV